MLYSVLQLAGDEQSGLFVKKNHTLLNNFSCSLWSAYDLLMLVKFRKQEIIFDFTFLQVLVLVAFKDLTILNWTLPAYLVLAMAE